MRASSVLSVLTILLCFTDNALGRHHRRFIRRVSESTRISFEKVFYEDDGDQDMETAETFMAGFSSKHNRPAPAAPAAPTFIMMPTHSGQFVHPQVQVAPQTQQAAPIIIPVAVPQTQQPVPRPQFSQIVGGGLPRGRLVAVRPGGRGRGRFLRQQRFRSQGLRQLTPQVLQPIVIQQPTPSQIPERSQSIRPADDYDSRRAPIIHQHVIQSPLLQPALVQPQFVQPTIQQVLQQQPQIHQPQVQQYQAPPMQMLQSAYPQIAHPQVIHPQTASSHSYVASPTTASISYTMPAPSHGSLTNQIVVQPHMSERERKKKKRREKMLKKIKEMME